jgi:hypothetical protein
MTDANQPGFVNVTKTKTINGRTSEVDPPLWPYNGSFNVAGTQTTPGISRGALINTGVYITNSQVAHVCDFKFNLTSALSLDALIPNLGILAGAIKNGQNRAAAAIRTALSKLNQLFRAAMDAILKSLNLDITGVFSAEFSLAKKIVREINEKIKVIAQILADVSFVYYLINDIEEIVKWIENLPERIKTILKECLTNFTTAVGNIPDILKGNLENAQASITNSIVNGLTENQGEAPQPTSQIVSAIVDPVNTKIDSITSQISSSVEAGTAKASAGFGSKP